MMTRMNNGRIILILPSSVFFFILVPIGVYYAGRSFDYLFELPVLELGMIGLAIVASFLIIGSNFVIGSIQALLVKGGGVPLGDLLPSDQSTQLVTSGVYRFSRNPMLFGYLLCLIAQGIIMNSVTTVFFIPTIFIGLWSIWLKVREEPGLETRFGETYMIYKRRTPFLIPRLWRKVEYEPKMEDSLHAQHG